MISIIFYLNFIYVDFVIFIHESLAAFPIGNDFSKPKEFLKSFWCTPPLGEKFGKNRASINLQR